MRIGNKSVKEEGMRWWSSGRKGMEIFGGVIYWGCCACTAHWRSWVGDQQVDNTHHQHGNVQSPSITNSSSVALHQFLSAVSQAVQMLLASSVR